MAAFGLDAGQGSIVLSALTGSIWVLLVFLIRLFLRLKVNGPFGRDDWACGAATFAAILHSFLMVVQVGLGFAGPHHHLTASRQNVILIVGWVAQFPFMFASGMSKVSACFLVARMTETKEHLAVIYGVLSSVIMWHTAGCILIIVQCKMPHPWVLDPANTCINRVGDIIEDRNPVKLKPCIVRPVDGHCDRVVCLGAGNPALRDLHDLEYPDDTKHQDQGGARLRFEATAGTAWSLAHPGPQRTATKCYANVLHRSGRQSHHNHDAYTSHRHNNSVCKAFFSIFSSGILSRRRKPSRRVTLPSTRKAQSGKRNTAAIHHDRAESVLRLQLRPAKGVNETRVEHIPQPAPAQPPRTKSSSSKRPSVAKTNSSRSILYTRDFEVSYMDVSFKDVGGVLNRTTPRSPTAAVTSTTLGAPPLLATPDSGIESSEAAETVRAQKSRSLTGQSSRRPSRPSGRSSQRSQSGSCPTLKSVEEGSVSDGGIDRRLSQ